MITVSTYTDKNFYSVFLNLQGGQSTTLDLNGLTASALKSLIVAEITKRLIINNTDLQAIKDKLASLTSDFNIEDISPADLENLADKLIATGDFSVIKTIQGKVEEHITLSPEEIGTYSTAELEAYFIDIDDRLSENTDDIALLSNNKSEKSDTYTKGETDDLVNQKVSDLVDSAPPALDTLKELAQGILDNQDLITVLNTSMANRVRFDVDTQSLTILQKQNARTNIGAASIAQGQKADTALQDSDISIVGRSGNYSDLLGKPTLALVATSGSYTDLVGKPTLATVATSGSYLDLTNKPTIPAAQVNSDWTAVSGISQILNKPSLSLVATTGAYTDLIGKPTTATTSTDGLMSSADKTKLDGLGNTGLIQTAEYFSSSTPNTVSRPTVGFTTTGRAETNVNIVIQPKGNGSFSLQAPDGGTTGGNARGFNSIDFQMSRSSAGAVLTGSYGLLVGTNNTVSGDYCLVSGQSNTISGSYLQVFGTNNSIASGSNYNFTGGTANLINSGNWNTLLGTTNTNNGSCNLLVGASNTVSTTSSNYCIVLGRNNTVQASGGNFTVGGYNNNTGNNSNILGQNCTVSGSTNFCGGSFAKALSSSTMFCYGNACETFGDSSVALGNYCKTVGSAAFTAGNSNIANANYTVVLGNYGSAKGIVGAFVIGLGGTTVSGSTQKVSYPLNVQTTDATQTNLTTNNITTISSSNTVTITLYSTYNYEGTIVARSTTGESAVWDFSGVVVKGGSNSTTAFLGTPTITQKAASAGASTWALNLSIENSTLGALLFKVTGQASTSIRWTGVVETIELTN